MSKIKLSELDNKQMVIVEVENNGEQYATTKEDYIQSSEYTDRHTGYEEGYPKVYLGIKDTAVFNLLDALENLEGNMYENWYSDVCSALQEKIDIEALEKQVNDVLEEYPSYYGGEEIDIEN